MGLKTQSEVEGGEDEEGKGMLFEGRWWRNVFLHCCF